MVRERRMIDDAAIEAMDRGWKVFPVRGKIPATPNGLNDASSAISKVHGWWGLHEDRGLAMATGEASGVWALDLDGEEGQAAIRKLQEEHERLPETPASETRNGYHLLFRMPEDRDVRNSAKKVAPGVDVRGTGGYIVLPPSPHPDGGRYRWIDGRTPDDVQPAAAPDWLLEKVTAPGRSGGNGRPASAEALPDTIPSGQRNETLASLAGTMRRRGATPHAIRAALREENKARCEPPLPEEEVDSIAASIGRYEPSEAEPKGERNTPVVLETISARVTARIGEKKLEPVEAVPVPWPKWKRACMGAGGREGLAQGWHIIVGAPSGAGKSLTATNIAAKAIRQGHDTALISLEMSQGEIVTRLLSIYTGDPIRPLEHGEAFDPEAWQAASERLQEAPGTIHINRTPITSLPQIEQAIRHHARDGCRLMIVDYLQLAWSENADTLYQQIVEVSHVIRGLARELEVTTVGLSQVNRRTSAGGDTIKKEGLLGGSSLENDADQVVLLGRPERKYNGYESKVQLDKNRHGPKAKWRVLLDPKTLQLTEIRE